jgi:anti-sigma28 factor (negative regulator of flagellin synthesis)
MALSEITGGPRPVNPVRDDERNAGGTERKGAPRKSADNVELSDEARALFEAARADRFERIRERVQSGFYDSEPVVEKVVEGVVRDLNGGA